MRVSKCSGEAEIHQLPVFQRFLSGAIRILSSKGDINSVNTQAVHVSAHKRKARTPSHVQDAHKDDRLSLYIGDISEGGIRSLSQLGD